jgi:cytochrome c oxidase subunit 2
MFGFCLYTFYNLWTVYMGSRSSYSCVHGAEVDNLMNITWILIFYSSGDNKVLLYYFAFKYRGRKDRKALYFADN